MNRDAKQWRVLYRLVYKSHRRRLLLLQSPKNWPDYLLTPPDSSAAAGFKKSIDNNHLLKNVCDAPPI